MSEPKISVIVVNYNRANSLRICLAALARQDLPYQLIVSDDGSDDDSLAVAKAAGAITIWSPHNQRRTAAARWRGAQIATGELFVFLDSDIVLNPHGLKAYWDAYQRNPDRALGGYFKYLPGMALPPDPDWEMLWNEAYPRVDVDQGQIVVGQDPREAMGQMYYFKDADALWGVPFSLISGNMAIPEPIYWESKGWDHEMVGRGQDGEFSLRIADAGYCFSYLMDAKAVHLAHPVKPETGPRPHDYIKAKWPQYYPGGTFLWPSVGEYQRTRLQEIRMKPKRQFRIRIASPSETGGAETTQQLWGDYWVKHELETEFRKMGHIILSGHPNEDAPDVLIHLSGGGIDYIYKKPIEEIAPGAHKIIWVYSHPEAVTPTSLKGYDSIFCCSGPFAQKMRAMGYNVTTLLGATNKRPVQTAIRYDIGFVGGTRGPGGRPIISDLQKSGATNRRIAIYGPGWAKYIPEAWYGGRYMPYPEIENFYAACKIVLQDHRPEMAKEGFVSVKLFDILASGSLPVCPKQDAVGELFRGAIPMYDSPAHLKSIIEYYCQREDERRELIRRGQQIALKCPWSSRAELLLRGMP